MAARQPFVNLQPFKGREKGNLNEFLRPFEHCIQTAGIADGDRHQCFHLYLKGGDLIFFDQLPEVSRSDFDLAVTALRNRYQNDQRVQLRKLVFSAHKLKPSEGAQHFLTDLQRMSLEAYPNVEARNAENGRPAFNAENRANERNRRVQKDFNNGVLIKLSRVLLTQPDDTTNEELSFKAVKPFDCQKLLPR